MNIPRIRNLLVGIVLTAAGTTMVNPAPASAAYPDCSPGYFCVWDQKNYDGNRAVFSLNDPDWTRRAYTVGIGVANNTRSMFNRTGYDVFVYEKVGYSGGRMCINHGTGKADLSTQTFGLNGRTWEKEAESHKKVPPTNC